MTWAPREPLDPAHWRRRAEDQLGAEEPGPLSPVEAARVLHELRVHQLELEMQNQALSEARLEAEAGWERFQELYDFAPMGYFSVDQRGAILEVNLAGARLLGADRARVVDRSFARFLAPEDQAGFAAFLHQALQAGQGPPCEVSLAAEHRPRPRLRLEGARSVDGKVLQLAALDVTDLDQEREQAIQAALATRAQGLSRELGAHLEELDQVRLGLAAEACGEAGPARIHRLEATVQRLRQLLATLQAGGGPGVSR